MTDDPLSILWFLGGPSRGVKRIHHPRCRYAHDEYTWARNKNAPQLVADLAESGALEWHDACKHCSPYLAVMIRQARQRVRHDLLMTEIAETP